MGPTGAGTLPALVFPEILLLPKDNGLPDMPVVLNMMSLFDDRTVPAAWIPTLLWLLTLSFTLISAPGSASMPAAAFSLNTERLIATVTNSRRECLGQSRTHRHFSDNRRLS